MLKLSICILLFLGTQTYFLPQSLPWLGQLSSFDSDLFKKKMLIQVVHAKPLYKKDDYKVFVRDLKSQGISVDKKDGGYLFIFIYSSILSSQMVGMVK